MLRITLIVLGVIAASPFICVGVSLLATAFVGGY